VLERRSSKQDELIKRQRSPVKPKEEGASKQSGGDKKESNPQNQKVMITGDDILIEYVSRLMSLFTENKVSEETLTGEQQSKIEKFITHYVWYAQDKQKQEQDQKSGSLKLRLENRLTEM